MNLDISDFALPASIWLNQGKYQIQAVIAYGSMAIIYKARDIKNEKVVIIKEFYPLTIANRDFDGKKVLCTRESKKLIYQEYKEAFQKECKITKYLQKESGFVTYIKDFYENDTFYLVTEYIEGYQFSEYIKKLREKEEIAQIFICLKKIAKNLQRLHKRKVLHLDIKPANLMMNKEQEPVIIDFGNASFLRKKPARVLCISQKYSSLEVMKGRGGKKSDSYSFGVLVRETLSKQEQGFILQFLIYWMTIKRESLRFTGFSSLIIVLGCRKRYLKRKKEQSVEWNEIEL